MSKPYSLGYNGHARICDCVKCAKMRAEDKGNRAVAATKEVLRAKKGATILVRAHFRKGKHLTKQPNTRKWLYAYYNRIYG